VSKNWRTSPRRSASDWSRSTAASQVRQEEFIRYHATKADLLEVKNSILLWVASVFLLVQLLPALLKKFGL